MRATCCCEIVISIKLQANYSLWLSKAWIPHVLYLCLFHSLMSGLCHLARALNELSVERLFWFFQPKNSIKLQANYSLWLSKLWIPNKRYIYAYFISQFIHLITLLHVFKSLETTRAFFVIINNYIGIFCLCWCSIKSLYLAEKDRKENVLKKS